MKSEKAFFMGLDRTQNNTSSNENSVTVDSDQYFRDKRIYFRVADIPYLLAHAGEWEAALEYGEALDRKEKLTEEWPTYHGGTGSTSRYIEGKPIFCPLTDERLSSFTYRRNFCYFKSFPSSTKKSAIEAALGTFKDTRSTSTKALDTLQLIGSMSPESRPLIAKAAKQAIQRELKRKQYADLDLITGHMAWLEMQGEAEIKWLSDQLRAQSGAQRWVLTLIKEPSEDDLVEGYKKLLAGADVGIRTQYIRHLNVEHLVTALKKTPKAQLKLIDFLAGLTAEVFAELTEDGQKALRPYLAHALRDSRLGYVFNAEGRRSWPWACNLGDLSKAENNWVTWADRILEVRRSWQKAHEHLVSACAPYERAAPLMMLAAAIMGAPGIGKDYSADETSPPRVLELWLHRNPPSPDVEAAIAEMSSLWVPDQSD
jgi:hypothetical protein